MEQLFKQEQLRLKNGKFCTKEQYRMETIERENKILRFERDKYYRAWCSASNRLSALERQLIAIRGKINQVKEMF